MRRLIRVVRSRPVSWMGQADKSFVGERTFQKKGFNAPLVLSRSHPMNVLDMKIFSDGQRIHTGLIRVTETNGD